MKRLFKTTAHILFFICATTHLPAQWEKTKGPKGVKVNVIYKAPDALYAGTESNGVYKSFDNGFNWIPANVNIERTSVKDIIFSGGNLLAAVVSNCTGVSDVYKCTDGRSWFHTSGLKGIPANSFAIKDGVIWAGVSNLNTGIYKSTNNGKTWKAVPSPIEGGEKVFISGNAIIVAEFNFIWRSTNDGAGWDVVEQFALSGINDFAKVGTTLFAASGSGIYTSKNNGQKWNYENFPKGIALSLSSNDSVIYVGSNGKVFKSVDTGATWVSVSKNLGKGSIEALLFDGENLFAGTQADTTGIYVSKNGGENWKPAVSGLPVASTVRSLFHFDKYIFAGTQSDGIYRTSDNGETWTKTGLNEATLSNQLVLSFCKKDGILFAGTGDGIYRSMDSGTTFTKIVNGFPTGGSIFVPSLTVSKGNIIAAASISFTTSRIDAIFYSTNNGDKWKQSIFPAESVFMSSVASDGDSIVYAASYGKSFSTTGLYKSTDKGVTFVSKTFSINADIDVLATKGRHVLAGDLFAAFFSNDFGETWIGSSPPGGGIFTYTIDDDIVYAGNQEGMYFSTNFGASWQDYNTGFPDCPKPAVEATCVNKKLLFAGAYLEAVWHTRKVGTGFSNRSISNKKTGVTGYYLSQNYPNPFQNNTQINFSVPETVHVTLKVYDMLGKEIAALVEETKLAGSYRVAFTNKTSGIYYYTLRAGNFTETKKMIMVK